MEKITKEISFISIKFFGYSDQAKKPIPEKETIEDNIALLFFPFEGAVKIKIETIRIKKNKNRPHSQGKLFHAQLYPSLIGMFS